MVRLKTGEYLIHCIMSDPYKPIERIPPTDEVSRVQRIESYKQDKRDQKEPSPKKEPPYFAFIASLFNKLFSLFQKKSAETVKRKELIKDLVALHDLFQQLIHQDRSHDPSYTQILSVLWQTLLVDCNQLESSLEEKDPAVLKFKLLLEEIDLYPPWEDHSLGFYLHKRAGTDWLPIPFMDILYSLHVEAKKSPLHNSLEKWCALIAEIQENL
ncbi:MAG: hypothetical protein A3D18_06175 [Chlamydiae bacterium RIFCSPHIGHO2_02_FULL_49_29]|nr:MAG: hypothetical protein A3D18_06175 [Chlamydiae bacterium RIFCSPHIGHO2_02_FULL_49_29]